MQKIKQKGNSRPSGQPIKALPVLLAILFFQISVNLFGPASTFALDTFTLDVEPSSFRGRGHTPQNPTTETGSYYEQNHRAWYDWFGCGDSWNWSQPNEEWLRYTTCVNDTATYSVPIQSTGNYSVEYKVPCITSRSGIQDPSVKYVINHHNGQATTTQDHRLGCGDWVSLGNYCYESGDTAQLVVYPSGYDYSNWRNNYTLTDQIRFSQTTSIANCSSTAPLTHKITVTQTPGGSIAPGNTTTVVDGENATFTIAAENGYSITDVKIDGVSRGVLTNHTFSNVTSDHTLTATFTQNEYTITASCSSGGSISPNETILVKGSESQLFNFYPQEGYTVTDIIIDGSSQIANVEDKSSYTFSNINESHTIRVIFEMGHTITVSEGTKGTITPGGVSGYVVVDHGGNVAFSIIPDSCYEVKTLQIDSDAITPTKSYTFTNVDSDHSIAATFGSITNGFTLTAVPGAHTTISPSGNTTVDCGATQTYTITYSTALEDLYVTVNEQSIQIINDGQKVTSDEIKFSATKDNELTLTLSNITEDTLIRLNEVFTISNFPLDIQTKPAPPNIMFVLDDSGSMDWEFMTPQSSGDFQSKYYIFANPGDNVYSNATLSSSERKMWKTQWCQYNTMYYNPEYDYKPWPGLSADDVTSDSRSKYIRSHPKNTGNKLDISADFTTIDWKTIPNAHYYVYDTPSETPYLVVLDYSNKKTEYYKVTNTTNGTGAYQQVSSINTVTTPPASVISGRTYEQDIQNWANWYTFYRKRELAATMAISSVVDQISNVYVGIRSINYSSNYGVKKALTPIEVLYLDANNNYVYKDETSDLVNALYDLDISAQGTPLRRGLQYVGQYFDRTDKNNNGGFSYENDNPWFSADLGGECQQSFAIVMTDGFYNGSDPTSIGNEDAGKGKPYADTYTKTLADVSMYYYTKDLVEDSTLKDLVPGDNKGQHLNTYGVAFGVNGSLGEPSGYTLTPGCDEDDASQECKYPVWPDPDDKEINKIDDLFHSSVNGRGLFLSASDPDELIQALLEAVNDIIEANGSSASFSVNGDELYVSRDDDLVLFQTQYNSPDWYGRVYAYTIDIAKNGSITATQKWEAGDLLETALSHGDDVSNRIIATLKNDPDKPDVTPTGVPFSNLSDLSATQQAYLKDSQDMLNYIRGSNEDESPTLYRERTKRLGDIVHSGAIFYGDYLYIGANDGMLHAFDAETGAEKFCYVPNLIMPNLPALTDQNYADSHQYYVDGSPYIHTMVSSATLDSDVTYDKSITYLIGGLGKGGKGYYMLDVTDPDTITTDDKMAARVMWEYPQADTPTADNIDDLGYSFSRAYIVNSNADSGTYAVSSGSNTMDNYLKGRVVVFGNGYGSENGNAVLYFLNPYTGKLIKKINVGDGPGNGLSTPLIVDIDGDYKMDYIYAGDLHGNLWKFDVTSSNPADWQVAFCTDGNDSDHCKNSSGPKPLFTAKSNQPITVRPDITRMDGKDGYMVIFGTGRFLAGLDWQDTTKQAFYGIWDFGDDDDDTEYLGQISSTGTLSNSPQDLTWSLVKQTTLFEGTVTSNENGSTIDTAVRILSKNDANWTTRTDKNNYPRKTDSEGHSIDPLEDPTVNVGWYYELPDTGERMTTDPIIRDGKAIMVSFVLEDDRCSGGAESWVHEIDVYTGGRLNEPVFDINEDGDVGDGDRVDINGDGQPDDLDDDPDHEPDDLNDDGDSDDKEDFYSPSAVKRDGRLEAPAVVEKDEDSEVKLFSASDGSLQTVTEKRELQGIYYWREN